jgi:hypothetical protein
VSLLGLAGFAGVSWQRSVALVSDDVGHLGRSHFARARALSLSLSLSVCVCVCVYIYVFLPVSVSLPLYTQYTATYTLFTRFSYTRTNNEMLSGSGMFARVCAHADLYSIEHALVRPCC